MNEPLPGLYHWATEHPSTGGMAHGHYHQASGTIFDPLTPPEGLEWFDGLDVRRIVLSCRHHRRDSAEIAQRFGCPVVAHEAGIDDLGGLPVDVQSFTTGEQLTEGVRAVAMNAIAPDDAAIHLDCGPGAILFADSIINRAGPGFVSDSLIGDDPEAVKALTRERAAALLGSEDFDALLFAHGDPIVAGGRDALQRFATG
jgi:hypothetical protein